MSCVKRVDRDQLLQCKDYSSASSRHPAGGQQAAHRQKTKVSAGCAGQWWNTLPPAVAKPESSQREMGQVWGREVPVGASKYQDTTSELGSP